VALVADLQSHATITLLLLIRGN